MSGRLVGEILDAAEAGHLDGLTRPAFAALFAIADRCHEDSRQGWVSRSRIAAAIHAGNSVRTVDRAIRELKDAGYVRVVKHGYQSHGKGHPTVFELSTLSPPRMAEASESASATQDGGSTGDVLPPKSRVLPPKQACASAKIACASATQGGGENGNNNGSQNGIDNGLFPRASATTGTQLAPTESKPPRKTVIPDSYLPAAAVIATLRAEFPDATDADLTYQHSKFVDYWKSTGSPKADWDATWRNWMRRANEHGELIRCSGGLKRGDAKVAGWLNAGQPRSGADAKAARLQALKTTAGDEQ